MISTATDHAVLAMRS